jgi:hypothetical protein
MKGIKKRKTNARQETKIRVYSIKGRRCEMRKKGKRAVLKKEMNWWEDQRRQRMEKKTQRKKNMDSGKI